MLSPRRLYLIPLSVCGTAVSHLYFCCALLQRLCKTNTSANISILKIVLLVVEGCRSSAVTAGIQRLEEREAAAIASRSGCNCIPSVSSEK